MPKLRDQVVVITGASSGIGRCTAAHVAARGARVVLTARRAEALDALVREIRDAGGEAIAVPGDVTRKDDLRRVARAAVERFGRIDTWVNNASVYLQGRVQDLTLDEFRRVLDVNLVGAINGTQCALEVMLPRGAGVIVLVSSVSARRGVPYTSPYSTSKAGLDGFASTLRAELWGSGVRISTLYPPSVDTPIYDQGRGRLGVVPKPAPPVYDPLTAAEAIAELAETGARSAYFGWARPLDRLNQISPAIADWLLHRVAGLTYTDARASDDNLYAPSRHVPPSVRAGWSEQGWKGITPREVIQVFPLEMLGAAAALGFLAARAMRGR